MNFKFKAYKQNWIFDQENRFLQTTDYFTEKNGDRYKDPGEIGKLKYHCLSFKNRHGAKLRDISATLKVFVFYHVIKNKEKHKRKH